jgi:4-amino-4-deoxy-L-arabinose transferase-like glycosyltransferase
VVEAIWLAGVGVRRALVWSLLANGASLGLGLLSRWLVGYP